MGLLVFSIGLLGLGLLSRWSQSRDPRWSESRLFGGADFSFRPDDLPGEGGRAVQFALGQVCLYLSAPLVAIGVAAALG